MAYKYANRYYTTIDTTLPSDDTTAIQELSGRQGDNLRVAYLQLAQTSGGVQSPWNLSGYTVTLSGKDSAGVVKTTNTATIANAVNGLINLSIPSAFYQAAGDYQRAFLQILNGSQVVSTVNVGISVYESGLAITTSQSETYLDSVSKAEQAALAMYDPLTTQTKALQSAQDSLTTEMKALQGTIDGTGVAKVSADNTFTGNNAFANITASTITADSISGNAWSKIQALVSGLVSDSGFTSNGINYLNGAAGALVMRQTKIGSVNQITVNGNMHLNESLSPWGPRRDAFQIPALAGAQNVQILNNEMPADKGITLWWGLNGTTLNLQNITQNGNTGDPGWIFQVSLTLQW